MSDLEMRMLQMLLVGLSFGIVFTSMVWQREVNRALDRIETRLTGTDSVEPSQPAQPLGLVLREIRDLLTALGPLTEYGVVGSRDVDQARYQVALTSIQQKLAVLDGDGVREVPRG